MGRGRSKSTSSTGGRRPLGEGGQGVRVGTSRHRRLVGHPLLGDLERRRQIEDGPPVLDGDDPAGAEGPPVAEAVDLVEDRGVGVARAEKVGVQGMHGAVAAGLIGAARLTVRLHPARPPSTVRPAATRAWPATCPPKTR